MAKSNIEFAPPMLLKKALYILAQRFLHTPSTIATNFSILLYANIDFLKEPKKMLSYMRFLGRVGIFADGVSAFLKKHGLQEEILSLAKSAHREDRRIYLEALKTNDESVFEWLIFSSWTDIRGIEPLCSHEDDTGAICLYAAYKGRLDSYIDKHGWSPRLFDAALFIIWRIATSFDEFWIGSYERGPAIAGALIKEAKNQELTMWQMDALIELMERLHWYVDVIKKNSRYFGVMALSRLYEPMSDIRRRKRELEERLAKSHAASDKTDSLP